MNKNGFIWYNLDLIIILLIYYALGMLLISNFQYILNSDGISYISIAQKYLNGNFTDAINGYWGPLFSWLLTPFLINVSNPQSAVYSMKILSLIIGSFTIIGFKLLLTRFKMEKLIRTALLISLIPITLYFSLESTTPDLLVTCILVYYFYIIFSPNYSNKLFNGFLCGLIGALAYLSKSYALPFFLAHFILFNLIYYFKSFTKEEKRKITKNLLLGLTIFFIISGAWITLISDKYEKITIGTTGEYNQAFVGPQSQGHFAYYQGLIKPPNNSAVSSWEDPSYFKMISWSPFESWDNFKYQIMLILENIIKITSTLEFFSLFSLVILMAGIILIFKLSSNDIFKNKLIYLLTTILLYSAGYSLILVNARYLWPDYILLIIMGGYLLNIVFKKGFIGKTLKNILLVFLIISFIITPINGLILDLDMGKEIYTLSETLKNDYSIHGNLASNDEWIIGDYMAFYTGSKYYGMPKKTSNYDDLRKELEDNNIDYYIVWGNSKENNYLSPHFKEITNGNIKYLKMYHLKTNGPK